MQMIRKAEKQEKEHLKQVVSIHMQTFPGFFLTFMGKGFLRQMYGAYCSHDRSGLLLALDENGLPEGFLAYSTDLSGLYKYMIKKKLLAFGWYSLGALIRKPRVFFRLLRAFLKPSQSKRAEAYVELASIGVSPERKGGGVGSRLVATLKEQVDFGTYAYITLETDAVNNEAANGFYRKNGFVCHRSFETPEGRKMNEYRFSPHMEKIPEAEK